MRKTEKNLTMLIVVFVASLLTANIISSNGMIYTNIYLGSIQLLAPGAVLSYAITFLCTDIIFNYLKLKSSYFVLDCKTNLHYSDHFQGVVCG